MNSAGKPFRTVYVYNNDEALSRRVGDELRVMLRESGIGVPERFGSGVELLVCVGGDGTLLRGLHAFGFPDIPVAGINTGHLGFFQELQYDEPGRLLEICRSGDYSVQRHRLVRVSLDCGACEPAQHLGLNDIVIKGSVSRITHLNLYIGGSFVEKFSGDGLLIASAGSTAYHSRGSIVDPRPICFVSSTAPMNTTAFRCLHPASCCRRIRRSVSSRNSNVTGMRGDRGLGYRRRRSAHGHRSRPERSASQLHTTISGIKLKRNLAKMDHKNIHPHQRGRNSIY